MDSWAGRKRPWEGDGPNELQRKRQDSPGTASTTWHPALHPPEAGYYSRDGQTIHQRRLPPLCTPTCSTSAETITSPDLCTSATDTILLDKSRPRSQSLASALQHVGRQGQQQSNIAYPIDYDLALRLNLSSLPSGTDVRRSSGFPAPPAPGTVNCCPSDCLGQECSKSRTLMHKLTAEIILLDTEVRNITQQQRQTARESSGLDHQSTRETLLRAIDFVQWTNRALREYTEQKSPQEHEPPVHNYASSSMRRGSNHIEEREEQTTGMRQYHGLTSFTRSRTIPEEPRTTHYGSDTTPAAISPHRTPSSSGSIFMPPQSPMQTHQAMRPDPLPSPSSLPYVNVQNLPPISPSASSVQISAQSAHLQDLQHQISVKTLAFQTLQREYDSLLQKLERQRIKCATLEKKFEVSDVEINSLLDEKERFQTQVLMLEAQVEDLRQSRDEARHQLVTNSAQYMRIMEMANRLQAQGAEDEKKWKTEKTELEQRIRLLEEAMMTGTEHPTPIPEQSEPNTSAPFVGQRTISASPNSSQAEAIVVLRAEIARLRSRTQTLETTLQSMRNENISIQAAVRQLVGAGGRMENIAQGATGES